MEKEKIIDQVKNTVYDCHRRKRAVQKINLMIAMVGFIILVLSSIKFQGLLLSTIAFGYLVIFQGICIVVEDYSYSKILRYLADANACEKTIHGGEWIHEHKKNCLYGNYMEDVFLNGQYYWCLTIGKTGTLFIPSRFQLK